jgi:hypothetical protein
MPAFVAGGLFAGLNASSLTPASFPVDKASAIIRACTVGVRVREPANHIGVRERRSELCTLSLRAGMVLQVEACKNHITVGVRSLQRRVWNVGAGVVGARSRSSGHNALMQRPKA